MTLDCACGATLTIGYQGGVAGKPDVYSCGCGNSWQVSVNENGVPNVFRVVHLGKDTVAQAPLESAAAYGTTWRTLVFAYLLTWFAERDAKAYLERMER